MNLHQTSPRFVRIASPLLSALFTLSTAPRSDNASSVIAISPPKRLISLEPRKGVDLFGGDTPFPSPSPATARIDWRATREAVNEDLPRKPSGERWIEACLIRDFNQRREGAGKGGERRAVCNKKHGIV